MAVTTWTKFYWSNWIGDIGLRRSSLASRGFWLDVLCVAAQNDRQIGYVEQTGDEFVAMMATVAGISRDEVRARMSELERNGVAKRDRRGRVFCPRMVRENRKLQDAISSGRRGGRASRDGKSGIFKPSEGTADMTSDDDSEPDTRYEESRA
ncbi:MAG: hypothetical protein ABL996_14675 [Micropepsaceae bacterium]